MQHLLDFLAAHQIAYRRVDHPAVFTCEEAARLVPPLPGAELKNLFLRDNKGLRHFLVTVPESRRVDLTALGRVLGAGRLGFASPERLKRLLGLEPGAVSLLAVINDPDRRVEVVIDREVLRAEFLKCHPLVNTSTLLLNRGDVERFLELCGHHPLALDVPECAST